MKSSVSSSATPSTADIYVHRPPHPPETLMLAGARVVLLVLILAVAAPGWGADNQAPSRPRSLTLTAKTESSVSLAWEASTDDVGIAAYDVFRDGSPAGISTSNSFTCGGLQAEQSYTFRVRARDPAGNVSQLSHALLTTPQPGGLQSPPVLVRTQFFALVLNYNPNIYVAGELVRADAHYGHRNVDALIAQYSELMRKASGGQMNWQVVARFDLDEWAPPEGSPATLYNAGNCVELVNQGYEYRASYAGILHDPRFNIIPRANQVALDAVWVFGAPGVGFWEAAMAGPNPYWINGAETLEPALTRNIVFFGFGKEGHQGVGFMCENTCHMTENIMSDHIASEWPLSVSNRTFVTLNINNPARALTNRLTNDWIHFTQAEAASWNPILVAPGEAQAGLSHFPPTALYNYDWSTLFLDFNDMGPLHPYDGAWNVENGEYHVLSGDGVKALVLDGMTLGDDLGDYHPPQAFSDADVELTVRVLSSSEQAHAGLLFRVNRCAAGPNQVRGYYFGLNPGQHRLLLARLDDNFTLLTNSVCSIEANTTCHLRLEARGGSLKAFLNDALEPVLSYEDSAYITGGFGLATYGTEAFFDNLTVVSHVRSAADNWYRYPSSTAEARDLSPLEWDGDRNLAMDGFYAWWWEHVPKNGGGHYATNLATGARSLVLNDWWPYIYDHNRFNTTRPFPDIIFPAEDFTPPSAPTGGIGIALAASRIGLTWNEASDNVGVTRYTIFRDGHFLRKTTLTSLVDTRLSPGKHYTYEVHACDGSGNMSEPLIIEVGTLTADTAGILIDGGFEFDPCLAGWHTEAFFSDKAVFQWEPVGTGRRGSRCTSITATNFNDARWIQTITGLNPGATYWLTGWIKGSNIVCEPGRSTAANLCLEGTWEHVPENLIGTFDWRQFSLPFVAPQSGTVTVGCRLGFWSNCASGKVWFDDIAVVRPEGLRLENPQFRPGGTFEFCLVAPPFAPYRIQQSLDLQSWADVANVTPADPITEISLPVTNSGTAFYRAGAVGTAE